MRIDAEEDTDRSIDLAPLLDCIFLLLIFFMISTTFDADKGDVSDIRFELPRISSALVSDGIESMKPLVISIDREGRLYADSIPASLSNIHDLLREDAQLHPNRSVTISSDRNVSFGKVAQVLDLCHFLGRKSISIQGESNRN